MKAHKTQPSKPKASKLETKLSSNKQAMKFSPTGFNVSDGLIESMNASIFMIKPTH